MTLALSFSACTLPGGGTVPVVSGEDSKSAEQILSDAADGLRNAKTIHLTVKTTADQFGDVTFDISVDESGNITGSGTVGGSKFDLVVSGGKTYIKGSDFWAKLLSQASQSSAQEKQLIQSKIDDHWITGYDILGDTKDRLKTDVFADCLTEHGALSKNATDSVGGKKVVVVQDKGDEPGGAAATYYVAFDSPHVLVRLQETGHRTPGTSATRGKCKGTTVSGGSPNPDPNAKPSSGPAATLDFSDYGKAVKVEVPTDTVDLTTLFSG